jgi:hypothetical protein
MGTFRRVGAGMYRAVLGTPGYDEVARWRGSGRKDLPTLNVLHVGDCGLRSMEAAHQFRAPVGFPRALADELQSHGIGVRFWHYFAVLYDALPDIPLLRGRLHLEEDPDVIVVQLGTSYARRVILPDTHWVMRLRNDLGRRLGRRVFVFYPPLRRMVRIFGRHAAPYPGAHDLERFLRAAAAEWPHADVLFLQQFPRVYPYPTQLPIVERTRADAHAVAERCGVTELDFADLLGKDPALRCANGYNLNEKGSELVGRELGRRIAEMRVATEVLRQPV